MKAMPPDLLLNENDQGDVGAALQLRKHLALPNGIYAECNLSANDLCTSIRSLLNLFSVPMTACSVFLRRERVVGG